MIAPPYLPPPSYEQMIEAVTACGISGSDVRISYEEVLQSDVVKIRDLGNASEEKFLCVRRALHPFYILEIERPDQREAYHRVADREDQSRAKDEAVAWLREHNLLDRVPDFRPTVGIEEFSRSLEAACSLEAGTAIQALEPMLLSFRRPFLEDALEDGAQEAVVCLMHMLSASNAAEYGIRLVFVGNGPSPASDEQP